MEWTIAIVMLSTKDIVHILPNAFAEIINEWFESIFISVFVNLLSNVPANSMSYLHVLEVNFAVPYVDTSYNWRWWFYFPAENEFRKIHIQRVAKHVMVVVKYVLQNCHCFGHLKKKTNESVWFLSLHSSNWNEKKKSYFSTFFSWYQKLWHSRSFDSQKLLILLGMYSLNLEFGYWKIQISKNRQ